MKTLFVLGLVSVLALGGCGTLPTAGLTAPSATGATQVVTNLKAFNDAIKDGPCSGWGNLDWNPPLPPTGGLHALCQFGNPNLAVPQTLAKAVSAQAATDVAATPAAK